MRRERVDVIFLARFFQCTLHLNCDNEDLTWEKTLFVLPHFDTHLFQRLDQLGILLLQSIHIIVVLRIQSLLVRLVFAVQLFLQPAAMEFGTNQPAYTSSHQVFWQTKSTPTGGKQRCKQAND
jgi:hypothetical protein